MTLNDFKAVTIGAVIGDALGVPVEFQSRLELKFKPVTDMRGFGTYNMPIGTWSDDSSMSIATLDSLKSGVINFKEIMDNFMKWYEKGEYTPSGKMFDVGVTTSVALDRYAINREKVFCGSLDVRANGNGSLMRIYPFVLVSKLKKLSLEESINLIIDGSRLTHAHDISVLGCAIYYFVLSSLLDEKSKDAIIKGLKKAESYLQKYDLIENYKRLFDPTFKDLKEDDIKSSGFVVDTLEASIWCVLNSSNYKECVLKAVNLGLDTDTVGTVAGSIAGLLYGYDDINKEWRDKIIKIDYIESLCEEVYKNNQV